MQIRMREEGRQQFFTFHESCEGDVKLAEG
jgi:hypothetical protein